VALASLRGSGGNDLVATVGDRLLTDSEVGNADEAAVSGMFGPEFTRQVFALEPGVWSGPLKSGFGFHLVEVSAITPAKQQAFEEVREALKQDWLLEKQELASKEYVVRLREKYGVELDDRVKAFLQPTSSGAQ
jgi:parvulin-like peptidyl-prolyl isomerase